MKVRALEALRALVTDPRDGDPPMNGAHRPRDGAPPDLLVAPGAWRDGGDPRRLWSPDFDEAE